MGNTTGWTLFSRRAKVPWQYFFELALKSEGHFDFGLGKAREDQVRDKRKEQCCDGRKAEPADHDEPEGAAGFGASALG